MDLYGRGHSVNPDVRYNVDLFATQIFELLTYLDIKNPINLVGLSMGGRVISRFAAVYPDLIKRLIYIGPSGFDVFNGTGYDDFDVTEEEVQAFIDADFSTRAESQLADFVRPGRFASWVGRF
jgi:pimeloyl-ACP methyl ester carboxylesterase